MNDNLHLEDPEENLINKSIQEIQENAMCK